MLLGHQLRRLREAAAGTADPAGDEIRASRAKISRMENGRVGFKDRDVADLLTPYSVTSEQTRTAMLGLAAGPAPPAGGRPTATSSPAGRGSGMVRAESDVKLGVHGFGQPGQLRHGRGCPAQFQPRQLRLIPARAARSVPRCGSSSSTMTTESPIWISAWAIVPSGPGKRMRSPVPNTAP
jgi:hypothetical protein